MARRRSKVVKSQRGVVTVWRPVMARQKIVYFLVADKPQKYPYGRSTIVYIGTTKKGASRIATSAAFRGEQAFYSIHGVTRITAHVIGSRPRRAMKVWEKLESAAILAFRGTYGDIPKLNSKGRYKKVTDEFQFFSRERLESILRYFEEVLE